MLPARSGKSGQAAPDTKHRRRRALAGGGTVCFPSVGELPLPFRRDLRAMGAVVLLTCAYLLVARSNYPALTHSTKEPASLTLTQQPPMLEEIESKVQITSAPSMAVQGLQDSRVSEGAAQQPSTRQNQARPRLTGRVRKNLLQTTDDAHVRSYA